MKSSTKKRLETEIKDDTENEIAPKDEKCETDVELNPIDTLRSWKLSLSKALFIYDEVSHIVSRRLNNISLSILIIGSISSIISGIGALTLSVDDARYQIVGTVINCVVFVLSVIITSLQGIIKIYNLSENLNNYSTYYEKLDHMYSLIANYLALPKNVRGDPVEFIKKESENYLELIRQSPRIDSKYHRIAEEKYNRFIVDDCINYKLAWKLKSTDQMIDVI